MTSTGKTILIAGGVLGGAFLLARAFAPALAPRTQASQDGALLGGLITAGVASLTSYLSRSAERSHAPSGSGSAAIYGGQDFDDFVSDLFGEGIRLS